MKKTKRKGFNFLRSYFDVLNEIKEDSDKLEFLLAVINKQFLDEDPKNLGFISNLCYESQRHSIETSVKGYMTKMKTDLLGNPLNSIDADPTEGGRQGSTKGGAEGACQQEKEKGQEKEEDKYKLPMFKEFLHYAKSKKENVSVMNLKLKYDSWVENGWKDGNGKPIKNWKTKLLNTLPFIKEDTATSGAKNYGKGLNQLRN